MVSEDRDHGHPGGRPRPRPPRRKTETTATPAEDRNHGDPPISCDTDIPVASSHDRPIALGLHLNASQTHPSIRRNFVDQQIVHIVQNITCVCKVTMPEARQVDAAHLDRVEPGRIVTGGLKPARV